MKRWISLLLAAALALSLAACGAGGGADSPSASSSAGISTEPEQETPEVSEETPPAAEETGDSNVPVAYFSWANNAVLAEDVDAVTSPSVIPPGNVRQLALWVQEETGGDLFVIRVTDPYASDWDACLERANEERGADARPALAEQVENLDQYDTVFLGYPKIQYGFLSV